MFEVSEMNEDESQNLRRALGQFATGVTVVTTIGVDADPVGITANSFSSVSLNPPLVLWSLADDALSREAFFAAEYFCVHILAASQQEISERFAIRGEEKFRGIGWTRGLGSIPLLSDFVARFQCRTINRNPVGDHTVFIGEVLQYDTTDERPLVFHGGSYALAERRQLADFGRGIDAGDPPGNDNIAVQSGRRRSDS